MTEDKPHHHGNLRAALIAAGLDLLNEGGFPALTLRRAAARAGVSHAAPAHHFAGLDGLLTAIAARAFEQFTAAMEAARAEAGLDPFAQLSGICRGYLAFASRNAGLFQLMFNTPGLDRADPDLARASQAAYGALRAACAPFASDPPEELELGVWSLVHGYALLGFATTDGKDRAFATVPGFDRLLSRLVAPAPQ